MNAEVSDNIQPGGIVIQPTTFARFLFKIQKSAESANTHITVSFQKFE